MMTIKSALLLSLVVLTTVTGCATGIGSGSLGDAGYRGDGSGPASIGQSQPLNCRNRGVYNRAANLCVSEGP